MSAPTYKIVRTCPSWCVTSDEPDHWLAGYEASHRRDFGCHVRVYAGEAVYEDGTREQYPTAVVIDHHRVEMEGESLYEADEALELAHQLLLAAGFAQDPLGWDRPAPAGEVTS